MKTSPSDQLQAIESATIASLTATREVERVGPFLAAFHPTSANPWLSWALPVGGGKAAPITGSDVTALRAAFRARGRRLRFEYFAEPWPDLAATLETCGLVREGVRSVMVCGRGDLKPVRLRPVRLVPVDATSDDAAIARVLEVARRVFGVVPVTATPMEVAEQRAALAAGRYRSVLAEVGGVIAGVGSTSVLNDELVGIGTLPAFRRQGVATIVSRHLAARHLAHRPLVWLAAGDAAAEAVYAAIGFRRAGVQLDWADRDEER